MSGVIKLPTASMTESATGNAPPATVQPKTDTALLAGPSRQSASPTSVSTSSESSIQHAQTVATPPSVSSEKGARSFLTSAAELVPPLAAGSSAPAPPPLQNESVRLWVGNIQPHVAECQLLRLAQPVGTITKFDFMLNGAGPQAGRPRGYAFISYSTHREADLGRRRLNGARLGGVPLVCRWANEQVLPGDAPMKREEPAAVAAPAPAPARTKLSAEAQIRAIEAKLQHMSGDTREDRFAVKADSERTDVRRLPRVRGPLSRVNAPSKQAAAQQNKPYARRRF
ncbi:probable RNA-binding protein 18 [Amphibalanus amphitrite]|uniref:probable RNA-binding protein 18 n=1 Tax=Amphibalanus amphitrite TaxID=1232801 RepID=UPI001C91DE9E|nr:probable RNA-binding protein 18 [Amphibalanus amphitrite]XP_043220108.1 probable RNA-binding protein 18 [Amphibalanus amphitrite]XP_043220109.1 probable RNA-binding protein 18 [Amphibalanus amphitrite]XP_043220110.1 probable RNA-binding protein 18 [Amphibalanus amphitrite]XP_043220111.1 probable RNA-binding protein 18 [Amphibalanus amphitrite]